MTAPPTVFVDADNTLWDTDDVYSAAQLALLSDIETSLDRSAVPGDRLAFVRAVDQELAARHHAGLRYPAGLLIKAVAAAIRGAGPAAAARSAWAGSEQPITGDASAEIEAAYIARLRARPALREGVATGLAALHGAGCLVLIVTEGARGRIERTAAEHGLTGFVERIIESPKRPELYRRVLRLAGSPDTAFMVGDQLERDIRPAKAAGLTTVYYPSRFRPRWEPDDGEVRPDYLIASFAQLPPLVLGPAGTGAGQ